MNLVQQSPDEASSLAKAFRGKTVLLTGHTGFKGSWLATWLAELGATVVGLSKDVPTQPSHFEAARLADIVTDLRVDLRDRTSTESAVHEAQPDFVFHLAAQPIVREAYATPVETYQTNVLGTIHVLEALRGLSKSCSAVLITSDKCYDNVEWPWGYRETDRLGGADPYSASKGAAELVIRSYVLSFFQDADAPVRIGVGRAGNVIGGGDWAESRIVPDCVRSWSANASVTLRDPASTRPWQHVLEPLSGYLALATALVERPELHGEPFNFGPAASQDRTVEELVREIALHWDSASWSVASVERTDLHEAGLLKLNCDKARAALAWSSVLGFEECARFTAEWYRRYYDDPANSMIDFTREQISEYTCLAAERGHAWAS